MSNVTVISFNPASSNPASEKRGLGEKGGRGVRDPVLYAVMRGFGGKPVKVMNLPNPAYQDYTQYKSVVHKHASDKATFSHSGTNGFTSTMEAGSQP